MNAECKKKPSNLLKLHVRGERAEELFDKVKCNMIVGVDSLGSLDFILRLPHEDKQQIIALEIAFRTHEDYVLSADFTSLSNLKSLRIYMANLDATAALPDSLEVLDVQADFVRISADLIKNLMLTKLSLNGNGDVRIDGSIEDLPSSIRELELVCVEKDDWSADFSLEFLTKLSSLRTSFIFNAYPVSLRRLELVREVMNQHFVERLHGHQLELDELIIRGAVHPDIFWTLPLVPKLTIEGELLNWKYENRRILRDLRTNTKLHLGTRELTIERFEGNHEQIFWILMSAQSVRSLAIDLSFIKTTEELRYLVKVMPPTIEKFKLLNVEELEEERNEEEIKEYLAVLLDAFSARTQLRKDGNILKIAQNQIKEESTVMTPATTQLQNSIRKYKNSKSYWNRLRRNSLEYWSKLKSWWLRNKGK